MTRETVTKTTIRCDFCQEICSGEDYKIRVVMGYALTDPIYIEGELRSYIPYSKPSHDICKKCADKALKRHIGIEGSDKVISAAPDILETLEVVREWLTRDNTGGEEIAALRQRVNDTLHKAKHGQS
ncbi:MAG: hypothetical protein Q4B94_00145 [Pseudomonadota bacterium]|nr:hypothetical protein [Pseudomonadota bacterium]